MSSTAATPVSIARDAWLAAQSFRLPFGRQTWRGSQGNWRGVGLGSSIDFQDHRAYAPGDDPRYIHWAAYARTGQFTMKLFRAEVSPLVDIGIDVSASMTFDPLKAARTEQLLAFCVHSADRAGAPLRVHTVDGARVTALPLEWVRLGRWQEKNVPRSRPPGPALSALPGLLPWRPGALKILISDLLFPGEPGTLLGPLAAGSGLALVLAPSLAAERTLPLRGNLELIDCESPARRHQRIDEQLAERYRAAYQRHFELWTEAARQRGVLLADVAAEGSLKEALGSEALRQGVVEHLR